MLAAKYIMKHFSSKQKKLLLRLPIIGSIISGLIMGISMIQQGGLAIIGVIYLPIILAIFYVVFLIVVALMIQLHIMGKRKDPNC